MKTISEIFQLSVAFLNKKQISRAKFLVQELLCFALKMDKFSLYMNFDRPLHDEEVGVIRGFLSELAKEKPIEQITGKVSFFGAEIHITSDVLIPRPETEILVDWIAKDLKNSSLTIWDVCTGSGCIGISLKKKFPQHNVILSDICEKALNVAKNNGFLNHVDVDYCLGDLLDPFIGKKADIIVCNPPYISEEEYRNLDRSVKDYEPIKALVAKEQGYEIYERMSKILPDYLNPGGKVYFEIGSTQGERVFQIFYSPIWKKKEVIQDWSGQNRFFFLEIE